MENLLGCYVRNILTPSNYVWWNGIVYIEYFNMWLSCIMAML